ncbi:accessory Sec system protein Asp3 [Liquorilactobacillus hordei]|uniref:accessory Sec system protein Asp3 n=1 Tax=Liquorilactobacillus hordei TaxID=468911 RepID=UPI0039EC7E86
MSNNYANLIYWEDASTSYLFGTKLKFERKDKVIFENELMSPGKELVSWSSKTIFQFNRKSPQLPLLKKGYEYRINLKLKAWPENSVWLKITFRDSKDQIIEDFFVKESSSVFKLPDQTASYQFSLINAGCEKVIFKRLELAEESQANQVINHKLEDFYFLVNDKQNKEPVSRIYFQEPELNIARTPNAKEGTMIIGSMLTDARLFIDEKIATKIVEETRDSQAISFHANGPIGFFACLYYSQKFKSKDSLQNSECYSLSKYLAIANKYSADLVTIVQSLASSLEQAQKNKNSQPDDHLSFVADLFERKFED